MLYFCQEQYCCCCSVAQPCPARCTPMDCSLPGLSVPYHLPKFAKFIFVASVMPSSLLILWCPLLLLPSIFPSIRVFSNELALHTRWPKYWSFSFSITPSNESSGLISFRIAGLISLLSKGLSRSSSAPQFESINSSVLRLLYGLNSHIYTWLMENHSFDY